MFKLNQNITKIISEIGEIALYLWQKGWAEKNAGNFSVNITEFADKELLSINFTNSCKLDRHYDYLKDNFLIVSAANSRMRDIAKNPFKYLLIVKINQDLYTYINLDENQKLKPSSELPTHLSVHNLLVQKGGNDKALLHTHPIELIAITHNTKYKSSENLTNLLWNMHPETIMFLPEGIGVVPYTMPGSGEIAAKTCTCFDKYKLVVWEKHGCLAVAKNITEAYDLIDTAVKSADIYFKCKNAGFEPEGLSNEQMTELKQKFGV